MMHTLEEAWTEVEETLGSAKAIAWDNCHKIYILMDDKQVSLMRQYEYDPLITREQASADEMLWLLKSWYANSCGLKFVNSVETVAENPNDGYKNLIPQFFVEESDEETCLDCDDAVYFNNGLCYVCGTNAEEESEDEE